MGKVIDTTDFINTSMSKKSKVGKNFKVEDSYWLESLQDRVDSSWYLAPDRADIQEEIQDYNNKGYLIHDPAYKKIEVRLNKVYDDKGKALQEDFKKIIFKDIDHKCRLGKKYKFDQENLGTNDNSLKDYWLTINKNEAKMSAGAQIRRCNCNLGFLIDNNTMEWYEPSIIDYDPKYTITHLNPTLNVPNAQAYIITQFNEYTKSIKINSRFIIGAIDVDDISNNTVYKTKAIFRLGQALPENPNSVPFVMLALEQDQVNVETDYIALDDDGKYHYIADYYTKKEQHPDNLDQTSRVEGYCLKIEPQSNIINCGEHVVYTCRLCTRHGQEIPGKINFSLNLDGPSDQDIYYGYRVLNDNQIEITNRKKYFKSDLILTCSLDKDTVDIDVDIPDFIFNIQLSDY